MNRTAKSLFNLSKRLSSTISKPSIPPIQSSPLLKPFSSATNCKPTTGTENNHEVPSESRRDSIILEKFRLRQLRGSSKTDPQSETPLKSLDGSNSTSKFEAEKGGNLEADNRVSGPIEVVSSFQELGLGENIIKAIDEMGIFVPSEIQCVGVPAILGRKNVILSSGSGSGRTLSYLLPLLQMLIRDEATAGMKPKHPRAIILFATEESADEVFRVAKFINDNTRLNSSEDSGGDNPNAPIGMLVGTPDEVAQQIEEGNVFCSDIKYLVLDEADTLFDKGFGPKMSEILIALKDHAVNSKNQVFQTILVTSTVTEMLGRHHSSVMERLERDNAGKVSAMLLEMDQKEVFNLVESPDALKLKVAEAIESLNVSPLGS